MSQFAKPAGIFGRFLAKGMAWGHRDFYKNAAKILDLKNDDAFLEIGFGSGIFIKKYASHVSRIAGIDYSEEMVNLARCINKKLISSGKADLQHGNASSLPWPDNAFSAAAAIETFFFWPEPEKALKEILRVLTPGGRFVIEMAYNKEDGLDHTNIINKMNLRIYGSREIADLLKDSGFIDVSVGCFKGFWLPFKGYVVPRGMVIKAVKDDA
ncbi:MAG: class I SAM-dependent methyltransferase [Chitinispirillaceae bacterium]|nr:class I SAM-dependent methyltransferase [Chitinispirillaceae bacterium]